MKHKHQMSLIARRAQIRRAVANRKDLPPVQPAGRPALRLVPTGQDAEQVTRTDRRKPISAIE